MANFLCWNKQSTKRFATLLGGGGEGARVTCVFIQIQNSIVASKALVLV